MEPKPDQIVSLPHSKALSRVDSRSGVALVIVLAFLVLITTMVVAFLSSVTTETGSVKAQSATLGSRQLADSTVQYVIGQIRQATSGGTTEAWASQPGMIRTYDSNGNAKQLYKLYSSGTSVITASGNPFNPASDLPGATWASDKALWTDLNIPVNDASNNPVFPVIDPRAMATVSGSTSLVEGFSYGKESANPAPAGTNSTGDPQAWRLPMPVRWLYMLKDGQFAIPSAGSGANADFSRSTPQPTPSNPIVGRVAFWTDDETCKLNINTAVGGNYWDNPTYTAGIDLSFSRCKPVKNEFARYPGHPATTSLTPVLWSFGGLSSPDYSLFPALNPTTYQVQEDLTLGSKLVLSATAKNFFQQCLNFSPRNMWGGSEMGSKATVTNQGATVAAPTDADRLYASIDEAFFGMPGAGVVTRGTNAFPFAPADLNKLRFFLTAQNRSPDTNPFNQPRVGVWPVPTLAKNPRNYFSVSGTTQTPTDKLIAFCSTTGTSPYYFTRNDPYSPTADFLNDPRNPQVFDYLYRSMQNNIPGFGGSLSSRYGQRADGTDGLYQLLTLCYDYIRSEINIIDPYGLRIPNPAQPQQVEAPYGFSPIGSNNTNNNTNIAPYGEVIPIQITKSGKNYKGLGRFVTLKQVGLQFIAVAANQPPCMIDPATGIPQGVPANPTVGTPYPAVPNPMHPWVQGTDPQTVTASSNGDGTWNISAPNGYPSISGQTHAGLPFLTTKWISDPTVLTTSGTAADALRATVLNPRYQGPATLGPVTLYGAGSGTSALNSKLLPQPWPNNAPPAGKSLAPHQTLVQAVLLLDPIVITPGNPRMSPQYQVRVRGMDQFTLDGQNLGFVTSGTVSTPAYSIPNYPGLSTYLRSGANGFPFVSGTAEPSGTKVASTIASGPTFAFGGGTITIEIISTLTTPNPIIQTFQVELPSGTFPTPLLPPMNVNQATLFGSANVSGTYQTTGVPSSLYDLAPSSLLTFDSVSPLAANANFGVGSQLYSSDALNIIINFVRIGTASRASFNQASSTDPANMIFPERMTDPSGDYRAKLTADTIRCVELLYGDARVAASVSGTVGTAFFRKHKYYDDPTMRSAHTLRLGARNARGASDPGFSSAIPYTPNSNDTDNYRGYPAGAAAQFKALGAVSSTNASIRSGYPNVTSSFDSSDSGFQAVWANGGDYATGPGLELDGPFSVKSNEGAELTATSSYSKTAYYINPDFMIENRINASMFYAAQQSNTSPNRQVASAVCFGSLPVGNTPDTSWRTLLFSPNPVSPTHLSLSEVASAGQVPTPGKAPDFLFLDFFNMPVVEPYAISEPFSTAGRVNMNYQIAPFNYIKRDTALRGVLRSEMVTAAEDQHAEDRKRVKGAEPTVNSAQVYTDTQTLSYTNYLKSTGHWAFRYPIHPGETLKQFDQRFSKNDIFRSPSEICSLWLYPGTQPTASLPENPAIPLVNWDANSANIKSWWYDNMGTTAKTVTGDNMRESPYGSLYPRLTTKSNTYTVHFKVQTLQKNPSNSTTTWTDGSDAVLSEYRGSCMIERYIDPADPNIPDFAQSPNSGKSLDNYYRYRVLNTKRFAP